MGVRHTCGAKARRSRSEEGASAVEFALVLGLLVLILVGIAQFGITFSQWLAIEHAAREGSRWGSLGYEAGSTTSPDTVRNKVWAAAPALNPRLTDAQITVSPGAPDEHPGEPVSVTVSYPTPVLPFMSRVFGGSGPTVTLHATAVNRIE